MTTTPEGDGGFAPTARAGARVRRERRSRPAEQRWPEILEAAAAEFQARGYEAASTAHIADAVGMLKGSLYYYINSKEDLLFAVIYGVHEAFLANRARCEQLDGDPTVRLRAFIEGHVAVNARESVRSAVFYRDFHSLGEPRRAAIIAERDRYDRFLRGIIHEGQEQELFCPDLDPKLTAIALLAMMNHVFQWYRPHGSLTPEAVGTAYADLLLGGVVCTAADHVPGHRARLGQPGAGVIDLSEPPRRRRQKA